MSNYLYYGFDEHREIITNGKKSKYNTIVFLSTNNIMNINNSLNKYPHVMQSINAFRIYTNQIKQIDGEYRLVFNKIDTRLLSYEESEDLLHRLIKQTLNQDTIKMFKKYQTLQHVTN